MRNAIDRRLLSAWLVLCALTLLYLVIDHSTADAGETRRALITVAAVVVSLAKVRIIMREFMDVRHAARWLRGLTDGVVALVAVALIGSYAAGAAWG